jgi:putative transposase
MDVHYCLEAFKETISRFGTPETMDTIQSRQFTFQAITSLLKEHDIRNSMFGKGSWRNNIFIERL